MMEGRTIQQLELGRGERGSWLRPEGVVSVIEEYAVQRIFATFLSSFSASLRLLFPIESKYDETAASYLRRAE